MLRLATLGGLVLRDAAGSGVTMQRRRLALLSLLSVAHGRGLSRDRLLALLWPESDESHARHSLEQLLYLVRQQIDETVFTGSDPLRLNPLAIASDVVAFEEALAAGRDEEAVALYAGPFLDGFHLGAGAEFEEWADAERSRLAGAHAAALERLATHASTRGDRAGATLWWRRLVASDRLSARYMLGLLRALSDAGERAEALRLGASYEALIREQLELPPDPAVRALLDELRAQSGGPDAIASVRAQPAGPEAGAPARDIPAPAHATSDQEPVWLAPPETTRPQKPPAAARSATLRRSLELAVVVVVALLTGWAMRRGVASPPPPSDGQHRVLLGSWRVQGDPTLAYLSDTIPTLLASWFAEDPTRERRVERMLTGEAAAIGPGRLLLTARVGAPADGSPATGVSVTGASDSLTALVDRLAARVRARLAGEDPERVASLITRSPEALSAFLEGRAEHRGGRDASARSSFARALRHDSTFALAALELALSSARVFRWTILSVDTAHVARGVSLAGEGQSLSEHDLWDRAMAMAWREREQLAPGERALLDALRVDMPQAAYASDVLAAWERAVRAAPDRAEAHYWLGYVLLHQGLAMGLDDSRARAEAAFLHVLEMDPAHLGALAALVEIAAYDGDAEALRSRRASYLEISPSGAEADYVRWLAAAALPDRRELRRIRARFAALDVGTLARIQRTSQQSGIALEDAERADSVLLERIHERQERQVALYRAIFLQLNRGRPAEALRLMRLKREVDPGPELGQTFALRYTLMWEGDRATGEAAAQALVVEAERPALPTVIASAPLWRLWHGDTTGAAAGIARLREKGQPIQAEANAVMLEALLADALHRPDAAGLRLRLDSFAVRGCCDQPHFINLVAARVHEHAGDFPAALAAVRRGRWFFPGEYLSTYLREEARLAALVGDTGGAVRAYRDYLAMRSDPEPSARARADAARAELARLEARLARR